MREPRAFTLIELLVVIAIVVALAAALLAFGRGTRTQRAANHIRVADVEQKSRPPPMSRRGLCSFNRLICQHCVLAVAAVAITKPRVQKVNPTVNHSTNNQIGNNSSPKPFFVSIDLVSHFSSLCKRFDWMQIHNEY